MGRWSLQGRVRPILSVVVGPGGRLAALAAFSLASAGGFSSPRQGGKCQFRTWRSSGGAARFEAARSGVSARSRSWTRSRRRRWNPRSRTAARVACSERPMADSERKSYAEGCAYYCRHDSKNVYH